ncbi:hypothetical protein ACTMTJ_21020 [Phytohabitans sp. LJ34]|uniref:hypothetical protein n=1 Tax=Phytohabitans sp. LJ34 TaxID=3452217 RepID=UPI003F895EF7
MKTTQGTATPIPVDLAGLDADRLDCYDDNLQALARHAGAADTFTPFARDWAFRLTADGEPPEFAREPVERRLRDDTGLVVTWHETEPGRHPADTCADLVAHGRPVFAVGDAYLMHWLPYAGNVHMAHSFVVTGVEGGHPGRIWVSDAYHNDTAWGPARPTTATIDTDALAGILGERPRLATVEPDAVPTPPDHLAVIRTNAAGIADGGALRRYAERSRREPHAAQIALTCWLGLRSRTRYGQWLDRVAAARHDARLADSAARFQAEVTARWRRASELAYLAEQRARRGRPVPLAPIDQLHGPVADAEATAAEEHLHLCPPEEETRA